MSTLITDEAPPRAAMDTIVLPSPRAMRNHIPLGPTARSSVATARLEIQRILGGAVDKLLVVTGPCSIHDANAALEYALRLKGLAESVKNRIQLVMRVYFEKPRTIIGWKGLAYEPIDLAAPETGLALSRRLLAEIGEIGVPCATEFLNPFVAPYLEDAISYGSIGARTCESQIHRELASQLPMPVGIKNSLCGNVAAAGNAVRSAREAHRAFGLDPHGRPAILRSQGNRFAHIILRGGDRGSNASASHVREAASLIARETEGRPVMVDCSHGNSQKVYQRQPEIAEKLISGCIASSAPLAGIMLESNLEEGAQLVEPGQTPRYGQSITDACIGWEATERTIRSLHRTLLRS